MLKERHEREKFLYLSTELKTKCDIIEILRRREKEHLMHLKDVINNISEGIIAIDGNMKVTLCNKSVQQIIGLKQLELMDYNNILKRYHIESEDGKNLKYYYYNYCKKNLPVKNLILKFKNNINGEIKYIEFSSNPIINSNGELIYTIITLKDITDKKLNQIYTKNQSEFIKNVLNTLDIPIAVLDYPGFKNRVLNNKFQQILNSLFHGEYNMEDIEGKNVCEVFSKYINNDFFKSLIYSVESNKEIILPPFSLKEPGKREKYYKMRITPYKAENGEIRIYIHGVDVTEEVNRSMELERISRMKDEFFTIISHELRTPLTIIYSSLQLAYDIYKDEITANINKTLDRIKQNCSRLLKLTNNIMDISKAEEGLLSINNVEFDLVIESERIVNLVNLYGRKKGLDIIFDTNEEECKVIIDREKYERILLNLLSNAIKYTPESKNIYVLLDVKEEYFILTIKDEGVGIPDKDKEFIFNRYSQIDSTLSRRAEGVGLGLTVVKKFVEAMEGKIFVKSKQGEGSEFSVVFDRYSKVKSTELSLTTLRETFRDIISIEMSDIN
ncbi:PAS domain S-box protein [Clostridium tetanomorphum]|uniref:histidine kinase n=2 Tax=Clostridium tetanomorphum TaxID=1553 RepID=A0A923EB28_CLOTT|nr:PAS domain S-box protein [Clostridium tetanomorphum]